jgi:hypothetical protein
MLMQGKTGSESDRQLSLTLADRLMGKAIEDGKVNRLEGNVDMCAWINL